MASSSHAVAGLRTEQSRADGRRVTGGSEDPPYTRALRLATIVVIGWGALSFGAVYPWAYAPLLVACAALGGFGLVRGSGTIPVMFAAGLTLAGAAPFVQLVPLPRQVLET